MYVCAIKNVICFSKPYIIYFIVQNSVDCNETAIHIFEHELCFQINLHVIIQVILEQLSI